MKIQYRSYSRTQMHGASVIFCVCIAFHSQHNVVRVPCIETLQISSLFMAIYGTVEIEF